jgi:hypothetical protein
MQVEVKNAYTTLVGKPEERIPLWKYRHRGDDNVKMVRGEMECENVEEIQQSSGSSNSKDVNKECGIS